jgi:hypothetical protein
VSAYFDINTKIEDDLNRLEKILELAKKHGISIAVDSNSRLAVWHDIITNKRGKILEEYMVSKDLYIMNENRQRTTFHNTRGQSNIDLTIVNTSLLKDIGGWDISDEDSCSDHSIIQFSIRQSNKPGRQHTYQGIRYIIDEQNLSRFDSNLKDLPATKFQKSKTKNFSDLDKELATLVATTIRVEDAVDTLQEAITASCDKSFQKFGPLQKGANQKSVPWWTQELTIRRRRLNAIRRRYQRTQDIKLRMSRKKTYHTEKSCYQAAMKREKLKSWKEFCTLTTSTNPWNVVYKLATNKLKSSLTVTTIQKPDVSKQSLEETMQVIPDYHIAVDNERDDNQRHKRIRNQIRKPVKTDDNRDLTLAEVMNAIEEVANKKVPGEDRITGEIYKRDMPNVSHTDIHNLQSMCKKRMLSKKMENIQDSPHTKAGKRKYK